MKLPAGEQSPAVEGLPSFDNSYARLPESFYARQPPRTAKAPQLLRLNRPLAAELGFDPASRTDAEWGAIFAGNDPLPGAEPLAMAYAGHQFGHFVPQLGDGRAQLLGEVVDTAGRRRDIQLKGAGRTYFSRGGDGLAALGPVLREYIVSEAMNALGVPTTRALAAVTTGERVMREAFLPGGVITRVAASHVRVGTFQFFAARGDVDSTRQLADYVIARHYPELQERATPYLALLEAVAARQMALVAQWMGVGFIHGVMNTDNVSIAGETLDYGPCAFMDRYHPDTVFSSIDQFGRYAYAQQPRIAQWNMARFAECLLPLIDDDKDAAVARATEVLQEAANRMESEWLAVLRTKLGLQREEDDDRQLIQQLLGHMQAQEADFTLAFRALADALEAREPMEVPALTSVFADAGALAPWLAQWHTRLAREDAAPAATARLLRATNPRYIPRNHQVEAVITAAVEREDFAPFHAMVETMADPFTQRDAAEAYATPPQPDERVTQTFCGT